jgi:hypothetical protein
MGKYCAFLRFALSSELRFHLHIIIFVGLYENTQWTASGTCSVEYIFVEPDCAIFGDLTVLTDDLLENDVEMLFRITSVKINNT